MNATPAIPVRKPSDSKRFWRIVLYTVLIISSLVMAFPLLFSFSGSVSSLADYIRTPLFPIPDPANARQLPDYSVWTTLMCCSG